MNNGYCTHTRGHIGTRSPLNIHWTASYKVWANTTHLILFGRMTQTGKPSTDNEIFRLMQGALQRRFAVYCGLLGGLPKVRINLGLEIRNLIQR